MRWLSLPLTLLVLTVTTGVAAPHDGTPIQETGCIYRGSAEALANRASPLDSVSFDIAGHTVKVCYGRPSLRGRTMLGGPSVPFGRIWRTGANEPTMLHTPTAVRIAGVLVPAGTYSLYTVPGERAWEVIVNRSYSQWGHESQYTPEVAAQEVDRAAVPVETLAEPIETLTMRFEDGHLVMEWEHMRIRIPITPGS